MPSITESGSKYRQNVSTEYPGPPKDECRLKKCDPKLQDLLTTVDKQNEMYDRASRVGQEEIGLRGEWWSRFTVTASGATIAVVGFVNSMAPLAGALTAASTTSGPLAIEVAGNAALSTALTFLRTAGWGLIADGLIAQGSAGAVSSADSSSDLSSKANAAARHFMVHHKSSCLE